MLFQIVPHRLVDATCLASARRWRTHADLLRDGAEMPVLTTGQRTTLLRDAEAAERQARPPRRRPSAVTVRHHGRLAHRLGCGEPRRSVLG